jgi:drug/metabolite transporter (DMT)-like permease
MAWLIFGEQLGPLAWTGVIVTMAGVALVLKRRSSSS